MGTKRSSSIAIVAFVIAGTAGMQAVAQDDGSQAHTACETSATRMYRACHLDTGDDFTETLANCVHEPTAEGQLECERLAREELLEERDGCHEQWRARSDVCELLGEDRYQDPLVDPLITFVDPDDVGPAETYPENPYVSVVAGRTLLLRAGEEGDWSEAVVIHVSDDVREIQGVLCRIVWDVGFEIEEEGGLAEYEPVELTQDWFAQSTVSDVYYCGEAVQDFEDGIVTSIDGSFESGVGFAKAGLLTAAMPVVGDAHRQEMSIGEAEDLVQYLDLVATPPAEEGGPNPSYPCDQTMDGRCLKTLDFSTLDPESTEFKYYLAGTGFILAVGMEDGEITGEREELVCTGDSLEILEDAACGLGEDAGELLDTLCELVPDALCLEED